MTKTLNFHPRVELLERFEIHREFTRIFQDAFVLIDDSGHILKFNQMFCQLVKRKSLELKKRPHVYDHLNDHEGTQNLRNLINETSCVRMDEIEMQRISDGELLCLIASTFPFFSTNGEHLGNCLLLRDVTAESRLQDKYKERTMESITDPLTMAYTRRHIAKEMQSFRKMSESGASPLMSVILVDVDHFKSVNDTYGHQAGDEVLKTIVQIMKSCSRSTDQVARFGGEEFVVYLPNTPLLGACIVAEKLRARVEETVIPVEEEEVKIQVTISLGAAELAGPKESNEDLIKRADLCLYEAKKTGRNRCIVDDGQRTLPINDYLKKSSLKAG